MTEYPCPCCGYLVFDKAPESYDICRICGWEDDLSQLRFPRIAGGANKVSLISAQKNFEQTGSSDPARPPLGRAPAAADVRDPGWRTLDEASDEIEEPVPGVDYGLTYPDDRTKAYYWRSGVGRG